jgi:hypothetical protein
MPYSITYDPDAGYCTIVVSGIYDAALAKQIRDAALEMIVKHGCYHFLVDCRASTLSASKLTLFSFAEDILKRSSTEGIAAFKIKRAFVIQGDEKDYAFYETVSVNRGLNVQIFQNVDAATRWLTEK